jgi:hypothetical protein
MHNIKIKTSTKFALLYLFVFLTVYLLATEMTLPSIPMIGGGTGVVSSASNVSTFTWQLSGSPLTVSGVSLTFENDLAANTKIYVELLDSNNNVVANGNITLASFLPAGAPTIVSTSPTVEAAGVTSVTVTLIGP